MAQVERAEIEDLIRQGAAAARVGDRDEARQRFEKALALDESRVEAWLGLAGVVDSRQEKRRCFERVLALDPGNEEARAGLEWLERPAERPSEEPAAGAGETLYCANHPDVETLLRCNRCGKPICTRCAVRTPVGFRCKECVTELQANYFTARGYDYPIAGLVTLLASLVAGALIPWLAGFLGFYGWIALIFVSPAIAGGMAEIIRRGVGRRRGRHLWAVVCGAAVVGSLIGLALLWMFTGRLPLIQFGIYVVLLVSTLYARTR